jgi:hypothetical protein
MKTNKYTARAVENDPRMVEIVNSKTGKVEFFGIFVVNCNVFPPDIYHDLAYGFRSMGMLKSYCAQKGVALFQIFI